jgi:hypothetical protein
MFSSDGSGSKILNRVAVAFLVGGILLAMVNLGLGGMMFGFGAVILGVARVRDSRGAGREERSIGRMVTLGGAFVMVDAVVRMLSL